MGALFFLFIISLNHVFLKPRQSQNIPAGKVAKVQRRELTLRLNLTPRPSFLQETGRGCLSNKRAS